jgi:enoyl-CoA hydratase/carnithine racemase
MANAWVSAEQAVEYGIALECVPDAELLDRARAEAELIARAPLGALRAIKTTMLDGQREQVAAARRREDRAFAVTFGFDPSVLDD